MADAGKGMDLFGVCDFCAKHDIEAVDLAGKDYNDRWGTLTKLMEDPAKAAMFAHLKTPDGKWTVRDDVWVRFRRERGPLLAGPITLGFSGCGDAHHFGPELQFGHHLRGLMLRSGWQC